MPCENKGLSKPLSFLKEDKQFSLALVKESIHLATQSLIESFEEIHYDNLWKFYIPKKCKFFIWSLMHSSINTMKVIQKKIPNLCLNPNWCVLCKSKNDNKDHLMIHCSYAKFLWQWLIEETSTDFTKNEVKTVQLYM